MHVVREVQNRFNEVFREHFRNSIEKDTKIPSYKEIEEIMEDVLKKLEEAGGEKYEGKIGEEIYGIIMKKTSSESGREVYYDDGRIILSSLNIGVCKICDDNILIVIHFRTPAELIWNFSHEMAHAQYTNYGLNLLGLGPLKNNRYTVLDIIEKNLLDYIFEEKNYRIKKQLELLLELYRRLESLIEYTRHGGDYSFLFKADTLAEEYAETIEWLVLIDYVIKGKLKISEIVEIVRKREEEGNTNTSYGRAWRDLFGEKSIRDIKNKRWKLFKQFLKGEIEVADALIYELEKKRKEILKNYEKQINKIKSEIEKLEKSTGPILNIRP
jgi:hypothetical protein